MRLLAEVAVTLVFCPSFVTVEQAIDWFEKRGFVEFVLFRGPDGLVRGSGKR